MQSTIYISVPVYNCTELKTHHSHFIEDLYILSHLYLIYLEMPDIVPLQTIKSATCPVSGWAGV